MDTTRLALRVTAGIYAIGYFVALFLPTLPEGAYSDDRVTALLGDAGERTPIVIGGYALAVSGVAFLAFVALIGDRVAEGSQAAGRLAQAAGSAYGVIVTLAGTLFASVPMGVGLGELSADADPTLFRAFSNAGFHALLVPGLLAAAAAILACTLGLRAAAAVPRWCVVTGFVVAPLLLLGFAWVPQFLVPLWAVAVAGSLPSRVSGNTKQAPQPVGG